MGVIVEDKKSIRYLTPFILSHIYENLSVNTTPMPTDKNYELYLVPDLFFLSDDEVASKYQMLFDMKVTFDSFIFIYVQCIIFNIRYF